MKLYDGEPLGGGIVTDSDWDDEAVEVIDLAQGHRLAQELQDALYNPEILKTAFNASFERTCLSKFMGRITPPEQWSCTAVMSRELGLPSSLESVGTVLGLPEDKQKSKTGKALIRYFSIPCKPTKTNGERTRNLPVHDPDRWSLYVDYNRQDVEAEGAIRKKLSRFLISDSEQQLWVHDQHINDRGVRVDLPFVQEAIEIDEVVKSRVIAWLANEEWRMDVFNTHGKIYEASAEQMFSLPSGSIKKGDPMRQKGKIAELALGYGGAE